MKLPEKYSWIVESIHPYKGAICEWKAEWEADRFLVADKMFGMLGHNKEGDEIITIKCLPEKNEEYQNMYSSITPGYYMNKTHWISIKLEHSDVPKEFILACLKDSYDLVYKALPKKVKTGLEE
ncbi:MmcQ/YjbR family DNA-binding protein [Bacillus massiliigorillae]|uniref:MmcQ/YjbR family DNA-binding protein n=1 Tax=Bacillus massiliigorillae TaxID=1243664 RepID=UPI0003A80478|nr:MmcQ/YjbR family DNA-binding protein [Bacillus massiliigorillae]